MSEERPDDQPSAAPEGTPEPALDDVAPGDAAGDLPAIPVAKPRRSALGRAIAAGGKGNDAKPKRRLRLHRSRRDSRDPALLGDVVQDFVQEQGWQHASAHARLAAEWTDIVGPALAEHLSIEALDEDGVLHLRASSTAWATQVGFELPRLRARIDEAIGRGSVTDVKVRGPQAPSWVSGPRRVKGRGPRDTYG